MPESLFSKTLHLFSQGPAAMTEGLIEHLLLETPRTERLLLVPLHQEAHNPGVMAALEANLRDANKHSVVLIGHTLRENASGTIEELVYPVLAAFDVPAPLAMVLAKRHGIADLVLGDAKTTQSVVQEALMGKRAIFASLEPKQLREAWGALIPGVDSWLEPIPETSADARLAQDYVTPLDPEPEVLPLAEALDRLLDDARTFQETGLAEHQQQLMKGATAIHEAIGGDDLGAYQVQELIDSEMQLALLGGEVDAGLIEQQGELRQSILSRV